MGRVLVKSSSQSKSKVGRCVTLQQRYAEFKEWTGDSGGKQEYIAGKEPPQQGREECYSRIWPFSIRTFLNFDCRLLTIAKPTLIHLAFALKGPKRILVGKNSRRQWRERHHSRIPRATCSNNSVNLDRILLIFAMVRLLHLAFVHNGPKKILLGKNPRRKWRERRYSRIWALWECTFLNNLVSFDRRPLIHDKDDLVNIIQHLNMSDK